MKPTRPKRTRLRARAKQTARLPRLSEDAVSALEDRINYRFTDRTLLDRAMTHSSSVQEFSSRFSYERLEFLGDRVLGLTIADLLFRKFEGEPEGGLAPRLNALVNRDACASVSLKMELDACLILDTAEEKAGGREKVSILADICEALLGAVYLDGGMKPAVAIIEQYWAPLIKTVGKRPKDPKSALQEWAQAEGYPTPTYEIVGQDGPDHAPQFAARVLVGDFAPVEGRGNSKQDAQREAAKAMLAAREIEGYVADDA
ncbi:ribonuclease III [Ponticaulis sp.]|uniref:ribonuclease III n=1 Tax=Ponticaulis sp. TaxID=2020902 RepID=UPI000B6B4CF8|nr:ribonuclease III [Ponticaulis sp.]MAI89673.1 ribonuclease III [Ponticaulis sp.]OUY00693.1 MAG: ribonuclease III [Hyphomonadaceae bacterium TMED5]